MAEGSNSEDRTAGLNRIERGSVESIPEQGRVPWRLALMVSWGSLKRRFFRSLVTMAGVVLAISFLTYMQLTNNITMSLVKANDSALNIILQKANVDIFQVQGTDRMMVLLITLSLLACLVGIMNSMLMSVTERIKEIGTMKCLGALDSFIVKTYFIESSLQGVIGTFMGMGLGIIVSFSVSYLTYGNYVVSYFPLLAMFRSLVISLIIGTLLSVSASIAPAYIAARKQPVDAMRVEE